MTGQRATWLVVISVGVSVSVASASACTHRDAPNVPTVLDLGPHRIQVFVPPGWDAIDQGAQKRFRKGEAEIVLQNLGKTDWEAALASLHDDQRREVKSRRSITIDSHEALDVETWSRLDHTWPLRLLFVRVDDDVLAVHTPRMADADTVKMFESIRDSLHFAAASARR